ncbi:LTA synthase family protein [Lentibacillus cibarius]|uniref:LTA synthase family protein n=2 Tax=Lentibacillus cibarius TaxID=2583219 RepID=A0A549YFQ6_9BACI|nr:LTA synthase family protein [Lentibacillus cibarius]
MRLYKSVTCYYDSVEVTFDMVQVKKVLKSYFVFFAVVIALKFFFLRYHLFGDSNILHTFWYELSVVFILFIFIDLVCGKGKLLGYVVLDLLLSVLFFSMTVYERYFGTVPTYHDLGQMNQVGSVSDSIIMLLERQDMLYFVDFLILGVLLLFRKGFIYPANVRLPKKFLLPVLVACLMIVSVDFVTNKDKRILDQTLFSEDHGVLNAQAIKLYSDTVGEVDPGEVLNDVTVDDIIQLKGNEPVPFSEHTHYNVAKDRNLIVLQIESLQDFVINLEVNGQEITPNINAWLDESLYFDNVYQQIGAGNTSDAEFMMNTSIYPVGDTPTSDQLADKAIPSLPKLLNEQGYRTATFHAGDIDYWNRSTMYPVLGFDDYYSLDNFYEEKDVVGFGPSDGYFYDKTMEKLNAFAEQEQPFYAHVVSLTSHTPFKMPEARRGLDLPEKFQGTLTGNYLQSVHYADKVLGKFFDDLKQAGIWDKSVIALYGDHSGVHGQLVKDEDVQLLHDLLGHPYSLLNRFNIPFIIEAPGITAENGERIDTVGGQLDMMPTLLNMLGVKPKGLYFGHDLLQYDSNLLGMRYYLSSGAFFNNDVLFIPETVRHDVRIYDMEGGGQFDDLSDPMEYFEDDYEHILQLYEWSDAYFGSLSR